ncbi:rRNA-processing protein NOP12 [Aspergillus melleus]|uniref:rRNA-processing protein NOP12 n=1 Tax=Aspergillus melleus TaxID=138277 RepID=UPI001E8CE345|nr:Nucleolar protein 12 [Aspergillus melleus]KAH8433656.1 Nucleolar protein 12 [Aspergillus melleus]
MGKKSKSQSEKTPQTSKPEASFPLLGGNASVDPTLASLFEKSAGPVKVPEVVATQAVDDESAENEEASGLEPDSADDDKIMQEASEPADEAAKEASEAPNRKRKRTNGEDLEETYMRRLVKEEEKEEKKRRSEKAKRQKVDEEAEEENDEDESSSEQSEEEAESSDEDGAKIALPKHESQTGDAGSQEIEKSNRTVFLGNVSNQAIKSKSAKKTLLKQVGSFLSSLPESTGPHKVESIRFRSTAFASGGHIPKRASYTRQELLDDTTPSTNAYVVYSTLQAARKAPAALNGTVVLDRHLRVDSVAHPSQTDHKRCVFVGNLDFVDHENNPDDEEKKKKRKAPADVEEGLWRTFNAHTTGSKEKDARGNVESVRVIRDRATRVGKGFAYVQFYDGNCVEEALLLDGKQFPPMLPRKLRVSRAKKMGKKRDDNSAQSGKLRDSDKTLQGRAGRLFGKAGAAKVKENATKSISQNSLVFEGHRATDDGSSRIRVKTKSRGSKGKPKNRSSQRAAAYKAAGGRKGKIEGKRD